MRIWVIISSVIILLFCLPGLVLAAFAPEWKDILTLVVLNALAIHGLYYCKVAKTEPVAGYRHLAVNQLLLGVVCALLLLRLNQTLAAPALWDEVYRQLVTTFQQMPGMVASAQEIEASLQETIEPWRRSMGMILFIVAALVMLSQAWFAWALYRRGEKQALSTASSTATGTLPTGRH